jgi:hypothetical protein
MDDMLMTPYTREEVIFVQHRTYKSTETGWALYMLYFL